MGKAITEKRWGNAQEIELAQFAEKIPRTELTLEQIQWDGEGAGAQLQLKDSGDRFLTEEMEHFIEGLPVDSGEGQAAAAGAKTEGGMAASHVVKACGRAVLANPAAFRYFFATKDGKVKGALALMWPESIKAFSYEGDTEAAETTHNTKADTAKVEVTKSGNTTAKKNVDYPHSQARA